MLASATALVGCSQKMGGQMTPLAVRFVLPPNAVSFADTYGGADAQLASSTWDGETVADTGDVTTSPAETVHVALWGGNFNGQDVTFTAANLNPGHYTFGYWNQDESTAFKGWVRVNSCGNDLVSTLRRWKDQIPKQKNAIAYDFELKGHVTGRDTEPFKSFAKQMRAFDRLQRQIDNAINNELRIQNEMNKQQFTFLNNTEVLLLPGGGDMFHPTTMPAFNEKDLKTVKNGGVMSKLLMVADWENAQARLRQVNRLCNELTACRATLMEEVDRLERRKRFLTITDHIYHHDNKFVQNEMQLQQTLAGIDQLEEQINEMRQRRLALAFTTELVAPDRNFKPLDEEQRDLEQERVVLEAKKQWLDKMFEDTDAKAPRRIALERQRQRVIRAIETADKQFNTLAKAKNIMNQMKNETLVIHRDGDTRLIAATFVSPDAPFLIRDAIESEAMMAVRLQVSDDNLTPTGPNATRVQTASYGGSMNQ